MLRQGFWVAISLAVGLLQAWDSGGFSSGLLVAALITAGIAWPLMNGMARSSSRQDPVRSPLASEQPAPPAPWLQPSPPQGEVRQPWQEMQAYRQQEETRLNRYQVIDSQRGIVQIPIERAMQILAAPSTAPTSRPTTLRPNREPTGGQP